MRQLAPKTILAVGLPFSLVLNACVAGLTYTVVDPVYAEWLKATAILSISVWLLFSVPILTCMAIIRARTGQRTERRQKILAAINCNLLCVMIGSFLLGGAYWMFENSAVNFEIAGLSALLAGTICMSLVIITGVNIMVRLITRETPLPKKTG